MIDLAAHAGPGGTRKILTVVNNRIPEPDFGGVLATTPGGVDAALRTLMNEVEAFHPNSRSSAGDLAALVRIFLLAQIDALWWGQATPFAHDRDALESPDLVNLDALPVRFRYRCQATTFPGRVLRAAERRILPHRTPRTAGLRLTRARPEAVALADTLAADFAAVAPTGTPPLWVTSLTRSVAHQQHLRTLGYAAVLPSSHCTGYGIDIEMAWYRRYGAHRRLERVLRDRQNAGDINVIDEGQAWHVCISPTALGSLRRDFDTRIGG
jgi:hypothetical protein